MSEIILVPLKVFGLGFIISMGMAGLIQLMLNAIKYFTRNTSEKQE